MRFVKRRHLINRFKFAVVFHVVCKVGFQCECVHPAWQLTGRANKKPRLSGVFYSMNMEVCYGRTINYLQVAGRYLAAIVPPQTQSTCPWAFLVPVRVMVSPAATEPPTAAVATAVITPAE